ncbi:MAG: hypothetical protein AABZ55_10200 [Bdellovibrionota bacterium]
MSQEGKKEVSDKDALRRNWMKSLGLFSIIIGDLIGFTGAGIGVGYLAMKKLEMPGWVLLFTSITGLGVAMFRLYRFSKRDLW